MERTIVVTPEDMEELANLDRRAKVRPSGIRKRGRHSIDWNAVMKPKDGEETIDSLLDRISDIDLTWLPGV